MSGKIACIGWGSLIWDSARPLALSSEWFEDGPVLPIEFARRSQDGRVTLVILEGAAEVTTLWSEMTVKELCDAREALRRREGTSIDFIGWSTKTVVSKCMFSDRIRKWLIEKDLDGAVWTALPPRWNNDNASPPRIDEIIDYLEKNRSNPRLFEYIERAPLQIKTNYRKRIEEYFGL